MQHVYKLDASHDKSDKVKALQVAFGVQEERFALGVIYETDREAYHALAMQNKDIPLLNQASFSEIASLAEEFI